MKDCELQLLILKKYYDYRHWGERICWTDKEFNDWPKTVPLDNKILSRICGQLGDLGLIKWYPDNLGGRGHITTYGVGVIEGTATPPDALAKALEQLTRIERNMEAVATDKYELRKENEELKRLHDEGYLKFAARVDGQDFRAFAAIMVNGNRKAAADFLKIPHRTFYDRVASWRGKGSDYKRLLDVVEWRKKTGRKIEVRLEDSLQSGEPSDKAENPETIRDTLTKLNEDSVDHQSYPELLRDILGALLRQNPGNFVSVRDELIRVIREEIPQ